MVGLRDQCEKKKKTHANRDRVSWSHFLLHLCKHVSFSNLTYRIYSQGNKRISGRNRLDGHYIFVYVIKNKT